MKASKRTKKLIGSANRERSNNEVKYLMSRFFTFCAGEVSNRFRGANGYDH